MGKIVDISPATVNMTGAPGQVLETVVTISPKKEYAFSILGLEQRFNNKISAELISPANSTSPWQVKVRSKSDKVDDLYEVITLKTDSKLKPRLKIRVFATYMAAAGSKS